ncbi:Major facilitator superfamily domain, general substrate transporter [Niveomyces insectorum RCEF 264]|uniref:Major facilitator superfamily domain, general substrate transporter n=1 Tax=Niveomyces insectorum RCEF 264 TaxID=1081102 RepID=A0A162JF64_9HYPO|nr:Major facilitator superfamily domain, general substrate transporter [Niveomyces insectorum RCEF 264]
MQSTKASADLEVSRTEFKATNTAAHPVHGHHHTQVQASHLYREDADGNVLGRVLIPQPTNDPHDPLTWSTWRKHMAFASVSFYVLLSNYSLTAMTPGLAGVIEDFGITATESGYLVSFQILTLGLGNLFWIPLALKYGKRPVLVISSLLFFVTCIWAAKAQSYGSLLASRLVTGFAGSASEAMGPAVVADLYFLHERATKTGFYTFMIGGGSALGGIFGGLVVNASNQWRWVFWMCSILNGTCFLLIAIFYEETNFARPDEDEAGDDTNSSGTHLTRSNYNFVHSLSLLRWHDRETSIWLYFYRPLQLLLYPLVLYAALCYGVTLGWVVFQLTANATYFPALYNFSPLGVGNLYIANLVGAVLGCLFSGPLCDWLIAVVTRRRGGYFEPEYRLYLMAAPLLFGPAGLLMWGFGLQYQLHWAVPAVGSGISYGVLCAVPNIGMTYVVDAHRPVAGEAMTSLTAFKNTFAFGLCFAVYPWILKDGFAHVSGYQTLIEGILFLLTVPLFFYGKKIRLYFSKFDV